MQLPATSFRLLPPAHFLCCRRGRHPPGNGAPRGDGVGVHGPANPVVRQLRVSDEHGNGRHDIPAPKVRRPP